MAQEQASLRPAAARVAALLKEKGRADEAVLLLAAAAAGGGNDNEGHELIAEALRIDPNSEVAQAAFARMEGIAKPNQALDDSIVRFTAEEIAKLERSLKPVFRRAQVGFNNNLKYKGNVYHVQTEDSGLDKPHIITHLFADGGRIIKSHKRSYAEHVAREDVPTFVRTLMKGQHMEMVLKLRNGELDAIIEGRATGGMEQLTEPPKVDVSKIGGKKRVAAEAKAESSPSQDQKSYFALHVIRSLSGGPERYDPIGDTVTIGRRGDVALSAEKFCKDFDAAVVYKDQRLFVEDLEGGNGVFFRIRSRVELAEGDEFIVGDQLLRLERNPTPDDGPDPGPTYFRSSMKGPSKFRVQQIFEGGLLGACAMARETTLQIGAINDDFYANDLIFSRDPLVAPYHCVIEEQAESFVLSDFGDNSGVFVRIVGSQPLSHGDEILVGRTRLQIDLSPSHSVQPLG